VLSDLRIIGDGEHAAVVRLHSQRAYLSPHRFVAIGDPRARESAVASDGGTEAWANVVSSAAIVSPDALGGDGIFIGPGAVVNRGAVIGRHSIVNSGAIVEHDVSLGAFVNVNPGAVIGGGAVIGQRTVLGLGCRIRDHITIGSDVTVGMGAVVVADVPDGVTVMGCPARICSTKPPVPPVAERIVEPK